MNTYRGSQIVVRWFSRAEYRERERVFDEQINDDSAPDVRCMYREGVEVMRRGRPARYAEVGSVARNRGFERPEVIRETVT